MSALGFESERTEAGEQTLVPGVRPVGTRERLERLMAAPMMPLRTQRPLDFGLFDEAARDQLDLFGPGGRVLSHQLPPPGG
jgi:hypothetical protein